MSERARLQDLAPKIGIDGEGFPTHAKVAHVGEAIKAIDQADRLVAERLDNLGEKVWRCMDVGVAHDDAVVPGEALKLNESGDFCVCAVTFGADYELSIGFGTACDDFADHFTGGIIGRFDAEENLD